MHSYVINHYFINTIRNSNMFQPLKGHLQGVQLIHPSCVGQQNELSDVKMLRVHSYA
jgi:hypothetical protein